VFVCACVFQRRRSAEDELAMRGFLQEGDLISVSCTSFSLPHRAASVSDSVWPGEQNLVGLSPGYHVQGSAALHSFSLAQNDALGFVTCDSW
jgi:hypothetical protein